MLTKEKFISHTSLCCWLNHRPCESINTTTACFVIYKIKKREKTRKHTINLVGGLVSSSNSEITGMFNLRMLLSYIRMCFIVIPFNVKPWLCRYFVASAICRKYIKISLNTDNKNCMELKQWQKIEWKSNECMTSKVGFYKSFQFLEKFFFPDSI